MTDLTRRHIAEQQLGEITWLGTYGECRCPGWHLHTTGGSEPEHRSHLCRVYIGQAPTIYCLHQSCGRIVETANHTLRSTIGKAESDGGKIVCGPSEEQQAAKLIQAERRAKRIALAQRGRDELLRCREEFGWTIEQASAESPTKLPAVETQWRTLLSLFQPDDIIWIGHKYDSGAGKEPHFQSVAHWLTYGDPAKFNFTCPSVFLPGITSRSNKNVVIQRFLVCESDLLTKNETLGVFRWLNTFLTMRAIVDTGGKSVHGWFEMPNQATLEDLRFLLPAMKMDPALFKPSQPVRLPGSLRDNGNWQKLIWFKGAS